MRPFNPFLKVRIVRKSTMVTIVDDDDGGVLVFELPTFEVGTVDLSIVSSPNQFNPYVVSMRALMTPIQGLTPGHTQILPPTYRLASMTAMQK